MPTPEEGDEARPMPAPVVTVVVPLFGDHLGRQTVDIAGQAWLDQGVPCEVVVVTSAETAELAEDTTPDVRIVHCRAQAPGSLRNAGSFVARGQFLYLTDADVAPLGHAYLAHVLRLHRASAAVATAQPWLYRLRLDDHAPAEVRKVIGESQATSGTYCFALVVDGRLSPAGRDALVYDGDDLMVVPSPGPGDDSTANELRWRPVFHWGGMLLRRDAFDAVGGYCADYAGWGCEDDDLLVKLSSTGRVVRLWRSDPTLACLHFEHARPYDTPAFVDNQRLLERRRAAGPAAMIESDRRAFAQARGEWAPARSI
jgi:hypothetical protein